MAMRARIVKENAPKRIKQRAVAANDPMFAIVGKRYYFPARNGMNVSVRAPNGLLAVKSLPSWVLL